MKLASPWKPRLADATERPHEERAVGLAERLVSALSDDMAAGLVAIGDRLPPHRELAWQLDLGLGTVTKAYALLERRGLVKSVRGRGMFVAGVSPRPEGLINLSINTPPQVLSDSLLAATLLTVAKRLDAGTFGSYAPAAGRPEHRALMARWLAGQGLAVAPEAVLLTHGAQHALAIAFAVACPPGTRLLTEAATYPGALMLARHAGLAPVGLAMDAEGLLPEALDQVLRSGTRHTGPTVLYVTPTLHNPTGATMGLQRRQAITRLAAAHQVTVVEDDVYALFAGPRQPPLASLRPEHTLHVAGLSKTLSPGLRIGSLVVPHRLRAEAHERLQATSTAASPLAGLIMEQWLTDGTADAVGASVRADAARRCALAERLLSPAALARPANGFHVWLPMPVAEAERFVARAAALGVTLMPARAPLTDPQAQHGGVRLSLGGPAMDTLARALTLVAGILAQGCGAGDAMPI